MNRVCTNCNVEKPATVKYFSQSNSSSPDGLRAQCKDCVWQKEKARRLEKYEDMFQEQNGLCKICSQEEANGNSLSIDHCHHTGVVRGLLCSNCNRGIGLLKDDYKILEKAKDYLKKWQKLQKENV